MLWWRLLQWLRRHNGKKMSVSDEFVVWDSVHHRRFPTPAALFTTGRFPTPTTLFTTSPFATLGLFPLHASNGVRFFTWEEKSRSIVPAPTVVDHILRFVTDFGLVRRCRRRKTRILLSLSLWLHSRSLNLALESQILLSSVLVTNRMANHISSLLCLCLCFCTTLTYCYEFHWCGGAGTKRKDKGWLAKLITVAV